MYCPEDPRRVLAFPTLALTVRVCARLSQGSATAIVVDVDVDLEGLVKEVEVNGVGPLDQVSRCTGT